MRGSSFSSSRTTSDGRSISNGRRQSIGGAEVSKLTSNGYLPKKLPSFQLRSSGTSSVLKNAKGSSKSFDGGTRSLDRGRASYLNVPARNYLPAQSTEATNEVEQNDKWKETSEESAKEFPTPETEESVPSVLYDMLQKEVIALRKASNEKDQSLKDKDDAIEVYNFSSVSQTFHLTHSCLHFII